VAKVGPVFDGEDTMPGNAIVDKEIDERHAKKRPLGAA
jgi:hypothetical protein